MLCNSMTCANNTMWDDEHLSAGYDSSNCIFAQKTKKKLINESQSYRVMNISAC